MLVVGLEGWIDAGLAAATATASLLGAMPNELVATFDADELIDYRARRPTLRIVNGVDTELRWAGDPAARRDQPHRAHGPDPDRARARHALAPFIAEVVQLAVPPRGRAGRRAWAPSRPRCPTPGRCGWSAPPPTPSWPAGSGSCRPPSTCRPASRAPSSSPSGRPGSRPSGCGPGSRTTCPPCPIRRPSPRSSTGWPAWPSSSSTPRPCAAAAASTHQQIEQLIAGSEEHAALVRQLEAQHDREQGLADTRFGDLPSGDELAAELERFLRGEH